ncbi:SWIM zinc finger domain-containing protein [uncultured Brevibacillus sp.]|uniref:SWIM zinc finger family protein n=1 Tax=uncultured Brevibacillus sp. TaxID=169970 RepID=UPI00259AC231|nr:SWIM zinc finger family protein [uncultured Brevibacillus sp.]
MKLSDLSNLLDPVILDRGRKYLLAGNVLLVEEVGNLIFRAEVRGGELYEVYVELDEDDSVLSLECECPYDYGPICKHQAAVLLKLLECTSVLPKSGESNLPQGSHQELRQLLEAESKGSLITLILSLTADSDAIEQQVRLYVSKTQGNDMVEECRKLIRTYMNNYVDNDDFITWKNVGKAIKGAELALEKAREAADDANLIEAVRIYLCILEEMTEMLQVADDSNGTVGVVIEECLEHMQELTIDSDHIQKGDREVLFRLILEASMKSHFKGWPDWQLALLANASHLAVDVKLRKEWNDHVSRMVSEKSGDAWSDNYFVERVALMQYYLIQTYESGDQASEFLNHHLHFSSFREIAIRDALENGSYDVVIQLAEEGEAQDDVKGLLGLVKRWKQYRFQAYRGSGQIDLLRKLGEVLVLDGDYSYYKEIKDTYPAEEWSAVYRNIMQKLEKKTWHSAIYSRILVEEKETALLLEYVRKRPSMIVDFYPYLNEQFSEQVKELFREYILEQATQSSTRKHYQNICRILRILQKAGGNEESKHIVNTLLAKYPNKSAFRDELMKLQNNKR